LRNYPAALDAVDAALKMPQGKTDKQLPRLRAAIIQSEKQEKAEKANAAILNS
jgi:hypothetical protein